MGNIFTVILYEMDMERVKFSLARYLRARLAKIERHMFFIAEDERQLARLSEQERRYLTELVQLHNNYFDETVFRHPLDDQCQALLKKKKLLQKHCSPSLDTYVVCLPGEDFNSGGIEFKEGEVRMVSYKTIKDEVASHRVALL